MPRGLPNNKSPFWCPQAKEQISILGFSQGLFKPCPCFFKSASLLLCCWDARGLSLLLWYILLYYMSNIFLFQKSYPVGAHWLYMGLLVGDGLLTFFFICRNPYFLSSPASVRWSLTHHVCLIEWKALFFSPAVFPLTSATISLQTEIKICPAFGSALT